MANIYLVRHGQAAASWNEDADPPLSPLGQQQAQQASATLLSTVHNLNEIQIISSPILRARQTADAFVKQTGKSLTIENAVSEIPSPIQDLQQRLPWLMSVMKQQWTNLDAEIHRWRQSCIDFVATLEQDSVIFSHYIAINVIIGHCQQKDEVICYHPDNASIHHFENKPQLHIIDLGKQAKTKIL